MSEEPTPEDQSVKKRRKISAVEWGEDSMKTARYNGIDGKPIIIEYDETEPCIICGNPVIEASMGGTVVCPSCDCGYWRDGRKMDIMGEDAMYYFKWKLHLRPEVPTFQEVNTIATAMAARGIHVMIWELACEVCLGERKACVTT